MLPRLPARATFVADPILCPGHQKCFWFCSETFCVRNKSFSVCPAQETSWATMCPQQCVRNNVSSFATALSQINFWNTTISILFLAIRYSKYFSDSLIHRLRVFQNNLQLIVLIHARFSLIPTTEKRNHHKGWPVFWGTVLCRWQTYRPVSIFSLSRLCSML